jgi:four helix bundle protein
VPILSYRDLVVWQVAMDLVIETYRIAKGLPVDERFGLCTQLRRSAVSIPANIAERHGRATRGEYLQHLSVAAGSLRELQTHLEIVLRLGHSDPDNLITAVRLADRIGVMLTRLRSRLAGPRSRDPSIPRPPSRTAPLHHSRSQSPP